MTEIIVKGNTIAPDQDYDWTTARINAALAFCIDRQIITPENILKICNRYAGMMGIGTRTKCGGFGMGHGKPVGNRSPVYRMMWGLMFTEKSRAEDYAPEYHRMKRDDFPMTPGEEHLFHVAVCKKAPKSIIMIDPAPSAFWTAQVFARSVAWVRATSERLTYPALVRHPIWET